MFPAELLTCQYLNVLSLAKKYCLVFKWIKFIFPACFTFQVRKQFPCHHNNPKDGIFPITLLLLKSVLLTQVSFRLRRLASVRRVEFRFYKNDVYDLMQVLGFLETFTCYNGLTTPGMYRGIRSESVDCKVLLSP